MLTEADNELFTKVGPGTPMGTLLRRYWHPVGCSEYVTAKPQRVRVLGEDLLLYRGASGGTHLMQLRCAHRNVALDFGRIENDCIRCPYHGWLYDENGQCVEQPAEPDGSTFRGEVVLASYRTQEISGLVFGYMGPEPAPLLPLYDILQWTEGVKEILTQPVHTNWLNHVENIVDISHLAWLHGHTFPAYGARKLSYHWDSKPYGVDNVMRIDGIDETHISCYGFPTVNRFAVPSVDASGELVKSMIYRVPTDDCSTQQYFVRFYPSDKHTFRTRSRDTTYGKYASLPENWWGIDALDQDRMAIEQQGVIPDRTSERLGASDGGIILMRKMLRESLELIERGEDPLCVIRDSEMQNVIFPQSAPMMEQKLDGIDYSLGGREHDAELRKTQLADVS
jgi:5,5'-dehydrodivanillate O-demethylase oxygenase subunit